MAQGFGPPLLDFSPLANLGQAFNTAYDSAQKRGREQEQRQTLALLGQSLTNGNPDYTAAAAGAFRSGSADLGLGLLKLGEAAKLRQQEMEASQSFGKLFGGSGASAASPQAQAPTDGSSVAPASLVQNESGGNWQAQNNAVGAGGQRGHFGRLQFGQARLQEAAAAGAIPQGTTPQQFMASPELQQRAEAWHFNDIDNYIRQNGLDRAVGQSINGVPVTLDGMRAVAHLGGKEGLGKFMASGGRYNPADENGTRLSDYFARHGGGGQPTQVAAPISPVQRAPLAAIGQQAPVQVAENEADVQRLEAQMPGYGGGSAVASIAGDDPIKLRQEAARYQQSNPEAARQMLARADAAERAAGTQVAQAAPQQGAPMADVPAQGAAPAQGFAIPQGVGQDIPPGDPAPTVPTQALMGWMANPRLPQAQRDVVKSILDRRQKYVDDGGAMKTQQMRLQNEKLQRELQGEGATPLSPEERQQYGIPADQPAYKTRSGEIKFGPAGTKIINEAQKGATKFEEKLGESQAKRWDGYIAEGDVAQGRLADIQTLREASRRLGSQGSSANFKSLIGPYAESLGIPIEGLSDIQLHESITQRLAPQLRAPGSGSTSDIEFKGFLRAIGPLSNTPAAREMIFDTYEAASRNDLSRAEIATRLATGEITRGQAERELRALPNPMEAFKKFREANPDLVGQAIKQSGMRQAAEKRDPVKVSTPEEAKKLPSGTRIILPDGRQGQVP